MNVPDGTAEATGSEGGLTVQSAADRIASLLTGDGDSDGSETREEDEESPQSDEEEGDEPETPEDESEETDEQPDDEAEQPPTFTVKVDGEEVVVTLDELQRGYSRTQDYTRKTMELAEARKAIEPELQAVRQEREQYASLLPKLEAHLQQQWEDPALQDLRQTNPAEYLLRREELRQQAEAIQAERQRIETAQREEQEKERIERRRDEALALIKVVPELQDKKNFEETVGYALSIGFTPEDIQDTDNHRAYLVLWKAMQFDRLKAKAPAVKARVDAVKTAKPGSTASKPTPSSDLTRAKQRLAKTGRVDDAAAAIERMLG
jgi:vacuolar-type H+-ATPase subunit I/STV1